MKTKKAFTIAELLISMSIMVIVIALVTSLVLIVHRVTQSQNYNKQCKEEYVNVNQVINLFVDTYSVSPFQIDDEKTNQSKITVSNGTDEYYLLYNKANNTISASVLNRSTSEVETKQIELINLKDIVFNIQSNIIRCEYVYQNYPTYVDIIPFGVD